MKKSLSTLFILFMSVGAYAQSIPRAYIEIGKCVNTVDISITLRLLIDGAGNPAPNNALIVSELPDPMDESLSLMSAFSADYESYGEDQGGKITFGTDVIDLKKGEDSDAQLGYQQYRCSLSY